MDYNDCLTYLPDVVTDALEEFGGDEEWIKETVQSMLKEEYGKEQ